MAEDNESLQQGAEVSLFAPRVHKVVVHGTWNDRQGDEMVKGEDGVWRVTLQLEDGEYTYHYVVTYAEGSEPYAIASPEGIQFSDDISESVLKVVNGRRAWVLYEWKHDETPLPDNQHLIIYEMHVGDFPGSKDNGRGAGTFAHVTEKLDYLRDLGINAIELMPVTQSHPFDVWGYSQISLWGVNNRYGSVEELAQLIDEAHARGIRVIFDGVYNHMSTEAPLVHLDNSYWFYQENPDEPSLQFGPKFNYEFWDDTRKIFPAREHALGSINRWVSTLHGDGIRFDATRAIKFFDLMDWFSDQAKSRVGFKPFFTIAEHMPEDPAIAGPNGPVDCAWHDSFMHRIRAAVLANQGDGSNPFDTSGLLDVMDARNAGYLSNYNVVNYLNNHDLTRLIHALGSDTGMFGDAAFRRAKLGATLLLTSPGVPMLWMGEEFGQATDRGGSGDSRPLDWSLLDNDANRGLLDHYRFLIWLRRNNSALHSDTFAVVADLPEKGIVAYKRWDDQGSIYLVAANLKDADAGAVEIEIEGVEDDTWQELVHNNTVTVQGGKLIDTLGPSEAKIFMKV